MSVKRQGNILALIAFTSYILGIALSIRYLELAGFGIFLYVIAISLVEIAHWTKHKD